MDDLAKRAPTDLGWSLFAVAWVPDVGAMSRTPNAGNDRSSGRLIAATSLCRLPKRSAFALRYF